MKLWDADHPYYCATGCHFERGCHLTHESWSAFVAVWGTSDEDMNLLFRWDWKEDEDDNGIPTGEHRLSLFYFLQRKGYPISHEVTVTKADEPAVREWLAGKWKHMQRLWSPFSGDAP
jgi:hypothetical protein